MTSMHARNMKTNARGIVVGRHLNDALGGCGAPLSLYFSNFSDFIVMMCYAHHVTT
jgi:hypothetical protein